MILPIFVVVVVLSGRKLIKGGGREGKGQPGIAWMTVCGYIT